MALVSNVDTADGKKIVADMIDAVRYMMLVAALPEPVIVTDYNFPRDGTMQLSADGHEFICIHPARLKELFSNATKGVVSYGYAEVPGAVGSWNGLKIYRAIDLPYELRQPYMKAGAGLAGPRRVKIYDGPHGGQWITVGASTLASGRLRLAEYEPLGPLAKPDMNADVEMIVHVYQWSDAVEAFKYVDYE